MLALKQSDGTLHIRKMKGDGTIGEKTDSRDGSSGWSSVSFYTLNSKTYLILLKKGNGKVHIQKMNSDGTVGPRTDTRVWLAGWTSVVSFMERSKAFLFLLKEGKGTAKIFNLGDDGKIGKSVKRNPLIEIKLPVGDSFKKSGKTLGQRKKLSSGDIATIKEMYPK